MRVRSLTVVIGGETYATEEAVLLGWMEDSEPPDWEVWGRGKFLYRSSAGRYFLVTQSRRASYGDTVEVLGEDDAATYFVMMESVGVVLTSIEDAMPPFGGAGG